MLTKFVENTNEKYEIREDGVIIRHYKSGKEPKVIAGYVDLQGYLSISISYTYGALRQTIHRLVAHAFVPNPHAFPHVDHIDEDKGNNRSDNLRWCTPSENTGYYHSKNAEHSRTGVVKNLLKKAKAVRCEIKELNIELQQSVEALKKISRQVAKDILLVDKKTSSARNYEGYLETSGVTFKTVDKMVETVGKTVFINGEEFPSAGAAARYIAADSDRTNVKDISRRIRKYLASSNKTKCCVYGKYNIS